ncbi:MAG TPA: S-layer homology domain-containing protein, partial [Thermoanaerobacterales bacterium]|nr:S-layer homology domain-containing protein [Thermoanaerobacterales bacterium]
GNGRFGPSDVITREQMAVMTDNFIKAMKAQLDIVNKKAGFTDQAKINSWSSEAVANMQQYGIIKGKTSGTFDPQGTATRAEAATILKGYIDSLLK